MLQIDFHTFPELTTSRLQLRQMTSDDAEEFYFLRSNDVVMKYFDIPKLPSVGAALLLIEKITAIIHNNEGISWGISLKDDPKLIGTIIYREIDKDHHRAEVGYSLHPDHWRKGIIQEALTAVLDYGFTVLKFHSIEASVNPENIASIKLLEKNKFVREAYYKENYFFNGKFLDTAVYSLLAPNTES